MRFRLNGETAKMYSSYNTNNYSAGAAKEGKIDKSNTKRAAEIVANMRKSIDLQIKDIENRIKQLDTA